jgi:hypothetical protein
MSTNDSNGEPRYILITQCLQNDFFLNASGRLCLPVEEVKRVLIGCASQSDKKILVKDGQYVLPTGYPENGPLGMFLKTLINERKSANEGPFLYILNIRDWHTPSKPYDEERKLYGSHCKAGSEGAFYINGLEPYLDPTGTENMPATEESKPHVEGRLCICHIRSDSVFDFGAGYKSKLEKCLEVLIFGDSNNLSDMRKSGPVNIPDEQPRCKAPTYIAVIGAYTNIKVATLLIGIRSQYPVSNLMISDSLTACPSLEKYITALDFFDKILSVEVSHDLNDLIRFLGGKSNIKNSSALVGKNAFAEFETYTNDKHLVLADRNRIYNEYLALTQNRSLSVYKWIWVTNRFLIVFGMALLITMLCGSILGWSDTKLAILGGIGIVQILAGFFTGPTNRLLKNLTNLVSLRIILENHSLKSALARFHLTTPETLRKNLHKDKAKVQVGILEDELKLIYAMESKTYDALYRLGFSTHVSTNGLKFSDHEKKFEEVSKEMEEANSTPEDA